MPGSQPGRFLFLAYRRTCHPSSLPPSSRFLLSPRKTFPLTSSGMVSSREPRAAASFIKRAFLSTRLSKWKRAWELMRLFLLCPWMSWSASWSCWEQERDGAINAMRDLIYPALVASSLQSLSLSSAATSRLLHIQEMTAFPWNSVFNGNNFSIITGGVKMGQCRTQATENIWKVQK